MARLLQIPGPGFASAGVAPGLVLSPSSPMAPNLDAQSLHDFLVSCNSDDIPRACCFIESMLLDQPPETALGFFRTCFSVLLQRVFGFQEISPSLSGPSATASAPSGGLGWLAQASSSGDESTVRALLSLLSPTGPLFSSLLAIDRENALHFIFPTEHLPPRIRRLLLFDQGVGLLTQASELFKNRIRIDAMGGPQVLLDLFEYYMFWFAYYAVCKESGTGRPPSGETKRPTSGLKPRQMRSLGSWVSSLHHPFHHDLSPSRNGLYLQLLQLYLAHFAQASELSCGSMQLVRVSDRTYMSKGEFLLHTFVEFWLLKDDPWPLSAALHHPLVLSQPGLSGATFIPPGLELACALRPLISHATSLAAGSARQESYPCASNVCIMPRSLHSVFGAPQYYLPYKYDSSMDVSYGLQMLQGPLYRFIGRAFLFWPVGSPIKQTSLLVDSWMDYLQPWASLLKSQQRNCRVCKDSGDQEPHGSYSVKWQGYVIANYPFYSSLVVHFLAFTLKFLRLDLEAVLYMTVKIFRVLTESDELLECLKKIECTSQDPVFRKFNYWDVMSSDLDTPRERRFLRLFDHEAFQAFQMFILQAEAELQFAGVETHQSVSKVLEVIKDAGSKVFESRMSQPVASNVQMDHRIGKEAATFSAPFGRHSCFNVKYRGDWMRRPIESTEVAWLARLLVNLSDAINKKLKLCCLEDNFTCEGPDMHDMSNQGELIFCNTAVPEVDLSDLLKHPGIPSDFLRAAKVIFIRYGSLMFFMARRKGWRVNIRFMAQKPVVLCMLLVLAWMLSKISHLFF